MDCPICLQPYANRPAVGPSGFQNGYTEWFVDTFCWLPPEHTDAAEIRQFVSAALELLRGQGPNQLLETGKKILRQL